MRRSVELAEASNSPDEIHTTLNNLANSQWRLGDLDGATASLARARQINVRFGSTAGLAWLDVEDMLDDELRGNWDAALSRADAFLEGLGDAKNYLEGPVRDIRTVVFTGRGDVGAAEAEARLLLDHAREVTGEQLAPALADAARAFHAAGNREEADALLAELLRDNADDLGSAWLRELPLFLVELGRADDYLTASEAASPSPWLDAGLAAARGELAEAADRYAGIGARATEAWARLLAAEKSADEVQAGRALEYFASVRATPFVRRCEALLGSSAQRRQAVWARTPRSHSRADAWIFAQRPFWPWPGSDPRHGPGGRGRCAESVTISPPIRRTTSSFALDEPRNSSPRLLRPWPGSDPRHG